MSVLDQPVTPAMLLFCGNDEETNYQKRVYEIYSKPRFFLESGRPVVEGLPVPTISFSSSLT